MQQAEMQAIFLLAGIKVEGSWEISNQYWPDNEHYAEVRRENPWWLVKIPQGFIEIGWRKRVISIDWKGTDAQLPVNTLTQDDVTQTETSIHAYSTSKAVQYLTSLDLALKRAAYEKSQET